jgi:hypothetical protein
MTYAETAGGRRGDVEATIVDDYRYDLSLAVNGTPTAREVVVDDARAVQVTAPDVLPELALPGAAIPSPLAAGAWVLDPTGASDLFRRTDRRVIRRDRLTDALDVLTYAREAVRQTPAVVRFNPDATTYRKEFDPFPKPTGGAIRYDLVIPALPRQGATAGGGAMRPPDPRYFRHMALYVLDDRVVELRESVSVESILADPRKGLVSRLGDYKIRLADGSIKAQAASLLKQLNALAAQQGTEPIRERELRVRIVPLEAGAAVELPADAVHASLTGIVDHGQLLSETSQ